MWTLFEPALRRLAREDLVHHDPATGAILVAYPFSGRSTAHQVRFDGREVYAMCAIDALGIAPMLDEAVEIASFDPLSDRIEWRRRSSAPDSSWNRNPRSQ